MAAVNDVPQLVDKKEDFKKNSNDELDEMSSEEYLRDLDLEYQERALLGNLKRFIKIRNNFSSHKANENTECYKCGNKGYFVRDSFSKTSNPSYQSPVNNFSSVSKGFQPNFTPKLIQSSPNSNSQNNPKFQKDYKAKYKKMKAKLALLEASPSSPQNPKTFQPKNKGSFTKLRGNAIDLLILLSKRETRLRKKSQAPEMIMSFIKMDHLGKFDAKADDGYFLGYFSISKAFRVYNIRRQLIEETYHLTFDESIEAIRRSLTEITQENHVPGVIALNKPEIPHTDDTKGPRDLINTKGIHEQNVQNDQMITQPTNAPSRNNTEGPGPITEPFSLMSLNLTS
uniref:Retrovirus-related Pol polyprotein from transposon TNT 1-94 n=1 Tax=Tanacetum cinerariifolium TaxID=118510 RepID=A0A699IFK0_TANCI|nr:retrovirus-related Pol polyprotein from transposon TNT 1-94 [Tanacetum cinerariifolium]